ncbi:RNA polymerase sigma-70 factor [Spirosoma profusum]|uniref:RNA polymerase sigma-70 factor n=1 Tax=Spirosoma profusum TaxID=2771354 RepID=UPI00293BBF55|nr:RNA polymerase sigma-70 factor [Spirosoma profusum]
MPPIEQDVIAAIRAGSERDFEAVFRQHYASLCRYARQLLPDADDAEEEVQAMFLALWEKRNGLIITVSLKSYLFRAVHNRCLNRLKHAAVRNEHREYVEYRGEVMADSPAQALIGDELANQLQRAIQKLPEQCRLAFTLSRFEELTYNEIAERLGISIKTVENQIGKALRILRTELSDYLPVILIMNNVEWIMDNVNRLLPLFFILHFSFFIN